MAATGETLYHLPLGRVAGSEAVAKALTRQENGDTHVVVANEYIAARSLALPGARRLRRREYAGIGRGHASTTPADSVPRGEPHVCRERCILDAHLVLDERDLLFRFGRVVGCQDDFRQSVYRYAHRKQQLLHRLHRPGR